MEAKKRLRVFNKMNFLFIVLLFLSFTAGAVVFQSPLVVDDTYIQQHGNVITGNYQGTTTQAAIRVNTTQSVVISNAILQGPGDLIQALNVAANITVTNTSGTGTNPNVRGVQKGIFLHVNSFTSINMLNNNISGVRLGFFCKAYAGDYTTDNTLIIDKNIFSNMDARPSDGKGSYETTGQYNGQAIHLGNIYGVPGIDIGWNELLNTALQSSSGALIEINESSGILNNPMKIHDNFIAGAYPTYPGKDLYGYGGILVNGLARDTASETSSYINIASNHITATANYGIALVAGHDITITNNRIISSGFDATTNAFYPMSSYGQAYGVATINLYQQPETVFFNNSVNSNVVGLIKNDGTGKPIRSDWNLVGQSGTIQGNMNFLPNTSASPTKDDEAQELANWLQQVNTNSMTIGVMTAVGYTSDSQPLTTSPPVNSGTNTSLVLDHLSITNPNGDCINTGGTTNSRIVVTNSVIGPCGGRGVHVSGAGTVLIQNNYIHDITSQGISSEVVADQTIMRNTVENAGSGIYLASNNVNVTHAKVEFNYVNNITGIAGQNTSAIQLNQISGPNNGVNCNVYTQTVPPPAGLMGTADSFSLFLSSGTQASPVQVVGNRINGGGAVWNGGGILLTDGDTGSGTNGPGYVYASDNLIMNPGGYGIDVSTGHDIAIVGNYVYGDNHNFYNTSTQTYGPGRIGINTFNVYYSSCSNINVQGNFVYYLSSLNNSVLDYGLDTNACSNTTQSDNTSYTQGQTLSFPSFDIPRPSCATMTLKK